MEKKNPPLTLRKLAFDFFRLIFPSHLAVSAQQRCSEELRFNHVWLIEGGMETKGEGDGGTGEVLCGYAKYAALFVFCSLSHTHTHTQQVNPLFPADAYRVSFAPSCLHSLDSLALLTLALSCFEQDANTCAQSVSDE